MSLSQVAATRLVVQRYEESLKQIACLKRQNNELHEIVRSNEIKAMKLIGHYKSEIDAQTNLATKLKGELCAREELEVIKRQRNFRDQSTWIEEDELQSKEKELLSIIYMLEDEIESLKRDQIEQTEDFERKDLVNQASVKQSFLKDMNAFRNQISNSVCDEVRDALADTVTDNERLTCEFRLLLHEMENLQESRDKKDSELLRTKRELEFSMHKNQLMASRIHNQVSEEQNRIRDMQLATPGQSTCNDDGNKDASIRTQKAAEGDNLEDYFKQCIVNTQREKRHSQISF